MRHSTIAGLTWILIALGGCSSSPPTDTTHGDDQRSVVVPFAELCPTEADYNVNLPNSEYVDANFGCVLLTDDCDDAYTRVNKAEESLCNAYRHYETAVTFDNRIPSEVPTSAERLISLRSSLYFLRRSVHFIGLGFRPNLLSATNETYQRYLASLLAEVTSMADAFAMDGADLAAGIGDALGGTYSNFAERQHHQWGLVEPDGAVTTPGRRGAAHTFLYGLPWRDLDDQLDKSPEDWPATLPLCERDATDGATARAVDLLRSIGVPVTVLADVYQAGDEYTDTFERRVVPWTRSGDPTYGRGCVELLYSNRPGVAPVPFEEILAVHRTSEAALEKAARSLIELTRVELLDLELHADSGCDYLTGFGGGGEDHQGTTLRARGGLYRVNAGSTSIPEGLEMQRAGLESIYAELYAITDCLLGQGSADYSCVLQSRSLLNDRPGQYLSSSTLAQVDKTFATLKGHVGERYIDYEQRLWHSFRKPVEYDYTADHRYLWGTNIAVTTPQGNFVPALGIYFHNFDRSDLEDRVKVFAVSAERNPLSGIDNEYYDLLSCLRHGRTAFGGETCDLSQWDTHYGFQVCELGNPSLWQWGDNACFIYLPHYRELPEVCHWELVCFGNPPFQICWSVKVCETPRELIPPKMFVVTLRDPLTERYEVIDTYLERRPSDVDDHTPFNWSPVNIYTRHFTDERYLSRKASKLTERDPRSCSLPRYNSLGLANDMPVPLENELISALQPGGSYEDSFAFFLNKAKVAAEAAGGAVDEALQSTGDIRTAEQHVTNLRQDALDRIEQICGSGNDGCTTQKEDYQLKDLNVLPNVNAPATCSVPDIASLVATEDSETLAIEMEAYLRCEADRFISNLGGVHVRGMPALMGNALSDGQASSLSYDQFGGEYKLALLAIDAGITDLRGAVGTARHELDKLGVDIATFQSTDEALDAVLQAQILEGIAFQLQAMAEMGKCAPGNFGCAFSAAANALRAIASAFRAQATALNQMAGRYSFVSSIMDKSFNIEQAMLLVEQSINTVRTGIELLELLELEQVQSRNQAERLSDEYLAQYVGGFSGQMKAFRLVNVRKFVRARREIKRAKVMAFIARKAVEMKLAVDLRREKQPGVIGAPPAEWAGDLFTMFVSDDIYTTSPQTLAADYVTRLEDYVYGYPFQYPFADGEDIAVLSMRDDLSAFDESCFDAIGETNLLPESSRFELWRVVDSDGGTASYLPDVEYGPQDIAEPTADRLIGAIQDCTDPSRCLVLESLSTNVDAPIAGGYVGSLYLKSDTAPAMQLSLVASYRNRYDHSEQGVPAQDVVICVVTGAWQRCDARLPELAPPQADEYIRLSLLLSPSYAGPVSSDQLELALWGAQIEECSGTGEPPANCQPTDYERTPVPNGACASTTIVDPYTSLPRVIHFVDPQTRSERLRQSFAVKCVDDDYAVDGQEPAMCAGKGGLDYFERTFGITLNAIEDGDILGQSQIAQGNYNYRLDRLTLNLVGSNIKDCTLDPGAGTSCYTNLFIPYDLIQDGQVRIRDHSGHELPFRLSVGKIHQGKAITAERLLTNPLSSTDQSLVEQYLKNEFRGRPIQGSYTLRIYGAPSLRWANLEDVQLYLRYRYWSPFSSQ